MRCLFASGVDFRQSQWCDPRHKIEEIWFEVLLLMLETASNKAQNTATFLSDVLVFLGFSMYFVFFGGGSYSIMAK